VSLSAKFALTNPDGVHFTMELTMSLAGWKMLKASLDASGRAGSEPEWTLRHRIRALVEHAEKHFVEHEPEP
jgi:hypothetical protein